jgi:lipoprotein-releasing system permease protein
MIGITVGTFALVAILSTFNGFEEVVSKLYNTFDSDLKVSPATGKYFSIDSATLVKIKKLKEVHAFTPIIEENALIIFRDNQKSVATIKALDPSYLHSTGIDSMIYLGDSFLVNGGQDFALVGAGVASKIGLGGYDDETPLRIYVPKKGQRVILSADKAFSVKNIYGAGVFSVQQEFDSRYVLVPLSFARDLIQEPERMTSLEINARNDDDVPALKEKIKALLPAQLKVQDRFQQQPMLYKVMKSEKLMVYLILSFVLLIAAFNLIGSLLMLAIEKQSDMATLLSMGATPKLIQNIILYEGLILSVGGALLGMILGFIVCWLQQKFGFIKIAEGSTFVIKAYPIAFSYMDFVLIFITVILLGFLASWYPAFTVHRKLDVGLLRSRE